MAAAKYHWRPSPVHRQVQSGPHLQYIGGIDNGSCQSHRGSTRPGELADGRKPHEPDATTWCRSDYHASLCPCVSSLACGLHGLFLGRPRQLSAPDAVCHRLSEKKPTREHLETNAGVCKRNKR